MQGADTEADSADAYSRKDKSLGLLCENFLNLYGGNDTQVVSLDEAAAQLGVERRRIYDVVNVLESVEVVRKCQKNRYTWHGLGGIPATLQRLQQAASTAAVSPCVSGASEASSDAAGSLRGGGGSGSGGHGIAGSAAQRGVVKSSPAVPQRTSCERKEKSLGLLSQRFIKLFLCTQSRVLTLDDAAKALQGNTDDPNKLKTKVRRLYDIANILSSLHLIEKTHMPGSRKPAFRWLDTPGCSGNQQQQLQGMAAPAGLGWLMGTPAASAPSIVWPDSPSTASVSQLAPDSCARGRAKRPPTIPQPPSSLKRARLHQASPSPLGRGGGMGREGCTDDAASLAAAAATPVPNTPGGYGLSGEVSQMRPCMHPGCPPHLPALTTRQHLTSSQPQQRVQQLPAAALTAAAAQLEQLQVMQQQAAMMCPVDRQALNGSGLQSAPHATIPLTPGSGGGAVTATDVVSQVLATCTEMWHQVRDSAAAQQLQQQLLQQLQAGQSQLPASCSAAPAPRQMSPLPFPFTLNGFGQPAGSAAGLSQAAHFGGGSAMLQLNGGLPGFAAQSGGDMGQHSGSAPVLANITNNVPASASAAVMQLVNQACNVVATSAAPPSSGGLGFGAAPEGSYHFAPTGSLQSFLQQQQHHGDGKAGGAGAASPAAGAMSPVMMTGTPYPGPAAQWRAAAYEASRLNLLGEEAGQQLLQHARAGGLQGGLLPSGMAALYQYGIAPGMGTPGMGGGMGSPGGLECSGEADDGQSSGGRAQSGHA